MLSLIAAFVAVFVLGGITFYFIGKRVGFNKGHWLGQKHALDNILPDYLAREVTGTMSGVDRKIAFPAYIKHGTLTLTTPHPGHFRLGESPYHRLPVYAEAVFSPDK